MDQASIQTAPAVGVADLNALKEFAADKRVRKGLFKAGQLISEIVCYEPGQSTVAHQHPRQDELFLVIDGCVNMNVGGTEYALPAGSVLSLKNGIMHDVRNLASERSVIMFVKMAADLAPAEAARAAAENAPAAPPVGVLDLNALKEFAPDKRVRKGLFKAGQLISEIVCYEPGQSTVAHQHPRQDELFVVLDGCVNMNVGGTEYALPAGSVLSLKSGIMHDVRNLASERSVIMFVKMAADLAPAEAPRVETDKTKKTPEFGVADLNAQKAFSAERQVRKALFKNEQLITEIVCYEPGQASVSHQHPRQNELFFVIGGCLNMNVGGTEYSLPAGSAMSVRHGTMHDVRNLGSERSILVFVKMAADLAPSGEPREAETAPAVRSADLGALKEFSAEKRVRKALFKDAQLISEMVCYEPGQSTVAHQHPRQNELFFVIDGCVNMNVGGTEHTLPAGSVLAIRNAVMHDVRNLGNERAVILFVKIAADLVPSEAPRRQELPSTAENTIEVQVRAIVMESETIHSFELRAAGPTPLPPFTAGAHVEVHMKEHLTRSYSIANDPAETGRYVIAVNREDAGRGGSRFMHSQVRVGQTLRISAPRNNFELCEDARHTVLIAGGIGITPLLSMIARLDRIGKPWTLHYCGRSRQLMAYLDLLEAMKRRWADVRLHVDSETGGKFLDMAGVVAQAPADSHFYCCGPKPMLQAFEAATSGLPAGRVHVEYFSAKGEAALAGGFAIELARSRKTLNVPAGKSVLDTLLAAGVFVDYSCKEGICGSCQVTVLDGLPDHRDSVLSAKEREANDRMLVCCSGARSPRLVLNL